MSSLIFEAAAKFGSFFKRLKVKQFLPTALALLILLTTNIALGQNDQAMGRSLNEVVHQEDSQRPKTTGEWNQQARETKGAPGERLKRIGEQSVEAVKDFGAVYPDTAQKSVSELKNSDKASK